MTSTTILNLLLLSIMVT